MKRLEKYLKEIQSTVYYEPEIDYHKHISGVLIDQIEENKYKDVLDVGVGKGYSLRKFKERGFNVKGITLDNKECDDFKAEGFDVSIMDMAFLDFEDDTFDLVWCRHALEHSVMPFIALKEFWRVLRKGKELYVELPSDNVFHIENPNHYSLFADATWMSLFKKAGFEIANRLQTHVHLKHFIDIYWQYWLKKI